MSLTALLDMPAGQVLLDHAAVDRLITAAAGATDKPYTELFAAYMKAASDPELTASDALRSCGVKQLGGVRDGLTMLEKADTEIERHHDAAVKMLEAGGAGAGKIDDAAAARALVDPVVKESRWIKAQRLGLAEADKREHWERLDRAGLEVGQDQFATVERTAALERVRESDDKLVSHLNGAITRAHKSGDLKVLDAAIAQARTPDEHGNVISLAAAAPSSSSVRVGRPQLIALDRDDDHRRDLIELDRRIRARMEADGASREEYQSYWELESGYGNGVKSLDDPLRTIPAQRPRLASGTDVTAQFAARLARARKVTGRYDGPRGEVKFREEDPKFAGEEVDLVRGLELRQAMAEAGGVIGPGGRL